MTRRKATIVVISALLLVMTLMVAGCRPTARPSNNDHNGASLSADVPGTEGATAWLGTAEGDPSGPAGEEQPGPGLPLDIEMVLEPDQTSFGPFYGLLPELAWSPDGRYLAAFGEKNGYGLWLWDQQTKSCRRLVQLVDRSGQRLTSLAFFGWNVAGDALLYAVDGIQSEDRFLGQNGVLVRQVGLDGTDKVLAWLPGEGMFIRSRLFNRESGLLLVHRGRDLWAVDTAGGRYKQVKSDLPTWDGLFFVVPSPTGDRVVYPNPDTTQRQLIILDLKNGTETAVGLAGEYPFYPVWSPDGEKLAFLSAEALSAGYDFQLGEDGPLPPSTRIIVTTNQGELLTQITPRPREKTGAPVWSADSSQLAFLTASVVQGPEEFPEISWHRLWSSDLNNRLQDLGPVSGDWLTIGDYTPDGSFVLLFAYEAGGGVSAVLQSQTQKLTLAHDAVDEPPIWWQRSLVLPRIVVNNGDYLDTQLYLYDPNKQVTELTSGSGWKSGAKISAGGDLAYISADNQNYPYPLTVVIQPLFQQ